MCAWANCVPSVANKWLFVLPAGKKAVRVHTQKIKSKQSWSWFLYSFCVMNTGGKNQIDIMHSWSPLLVVWLCQLSYEGKKESSFHSFNRLQEQWIMKSNDFLLAQFLVWLLILLIPQRINNWFSLGGIGTQIVLSWGAFCWTNYHPSPLINNTRSCWIRNRIHWNM